MDLTNKVIRDTYKSLVTIESAAGITGSSGNSALFDGAGNQLALEVGLTHTNFLGPLLVNGIEVIDELGVYQGTIPQGPQGPQGFQGISGDRYSTTSTTTLTIPNHGGSFTLTVGTGLAYSAQQSIIVANDGIVSFTATVTDYFPLTGVLNGIVDKRSGTGTYSAWTVNLSGAVGQAGPQGFQGLQGPQGFQGLQGPQGFQGPAITSNMINPNIWEYADGFVALDSQQWTASVAGSATTPAITTPLDTQESGAIQFSTSGVSGTSTIVRTNQQFSLTPSLVSGFHVRVGSVPDATDDFIFVGGVWSGSSVDTTRWTNQIGFRLILSGSTPVWQAICRSTTETTFTGSTAVTANTNYVLQWRKTGSSVEFYINGVLFTTISNNVPSGYLNFIYRLAKTAGTNARTLQLYHHYERSIRSTLVNFINI